MYLTKVKRDTFLEYLYIFRSYNRGKKYYNKVTRFHRFKTKWLSRKEKYTFYTNFLQSSPHA